GSEPGGKVLEPRNSLGGVRADEEHWGGGGEPVVQVVLGAAKAKGPVGLAFEVDATSLRLDEEQTSQSRPGRRIDKLDLAIDSHVGDALLPPDVSHRCDHRSAQGHPLPLDLGCGWESLRHALLRVRVGDVSSPSMTGGCDSYRQRPPCRPRHGARASGRMHGRGHAMDRAIFAPFWGYGRLMSS